MEYHLVNKHGKLENHRKLQIVLSKNGTWIPVFSIVKLFHHMDLMAATLPSPRPVAPVVLWARGRPATRAIHQGPSENAGGERADSTPAGWVDWTKKKRQNVQPMNQQLNQNQNVQQKSTVCSMNNSWIKIKMFNQPKSKPIDQFNEFNHWPTASNRPIDQKFNMSWAHRKSISLELIPQENHGLVPFGLLPGFRLLSILLRRQQAQPNFQTSFSFWIFLATFQKYSTNIQKQLCLFVTVATDKKYNSKHQQLQFNGLRWQRGRRLRRQGRRLLGGRHGAVALRHGPRCFWWPWGVELKQVDWWNNPGWPSMFNPITSIYSKHNILL